MTTQTQTPNNPLEEFEQASIQPYYDCTHNGVYYIAIETDSNGNIREKPPLRLSDAVRIIGRGTDTAGNHYRVISWQDGFTHGVSYNPRYTRQKNCMTFTKCW